MPAIPSYSGTSPSRFRTSGALAIREPEGRLSGTEDLGSSRSGCACTLAPEARRANRQAVALQCIKILRRERRSRPVQSRSLPAPAAIAISAIRRIEGHRRVCSIAEAAVAEAAIAQAAEAVAEAAVVGIAKAPVTEPQPV